jgi:branched-chain amino acid transport system ATP-binding protein
VSILQIEKVSRRFGGLLAVDEVSFDVVEGEIVSVIGPNGAGKSTLFKLISSFLKPTSGRITFRSEVVSGLKPHIVARKGIVRTFQETTVFKEMTALENVVVGCHLGLAAGALGIYFSLPTSRADEIRARREAVEILDYLGLCHVKNELARNLPHGHLRALGIATALAAKPTLLLLDEPFAGMNSEETDRAVTMVEGIRNRGVTILLVEHDMRAVMRISDRIVVINFGVKIAEGSPAAIRSNPVVIDAYLGQDDEMIGS